MAIQNWGFGWSWPDWWSYQLGRYSWDPSTSWLCFEILVQVDYVFRTVWSEPFLERKFASSVRETWLIRTWDMTHSYVRHDSFVRETWLVACSALPIMCVCLCVCMCACACVHVYMCVCVCACMCVWERGVLVFTCTYTCLHYGRGGDFLQRSPYARARRSFEFRSIAVSLTNSISRFY